MEALTLNAQPRTVVGKKVKKLRANGKMPLVIYGQGTESEPLMVDQKEYAAIYKKAGSSTLVNLKIGDKKAFKVLLYEPQRDPVKNQLLHGDIYKVKMTEKIKTEIPLNFIGISAAVDELEGNLITQRDSVEIECLPDALVSQIDVDLSTLKTFDDTIHISDITMPEGIQLLNDPEELVAMVSEPRSEAEMEALETTEEEDQAALEKLAGEEEKPTEE
jgi:large subunit ribosomal protein L25